MKIEEIVRLALKVFFIVGFCVAMYKSIDKLVDPRTSISIDYENEVVPLPSITICPYEFHDHPEYYGNTTLPDLIKSDLRLSIDKDIVSAEFIALSNLRQLDQVNTTNLKGNTDQGLIYFSNRLIRCLTFHPPTPILEGESGTVNIYSMSMW